MGFGETLREFGVKVSLNWDSKKFEEAGTKIEKFGGKLRGFALEVAGLTAGVFAIQNSFTSNARSLQNQADLLGINTEELQAYEYAAKVAADVNRDDLVGSLQTLGDTLDKARAGDIGARQSLEQIGAMAGNTTEIFAKLQAGTYTTTDAFKDLSTGIAKVYKNSPQSASRLTEQILGNAKLLNLMKLGPHAIDQLTSEGKKNFALNDQMIKQGAKMDIQMSKLWMTFRKFGYEIGFSVMKHLAPMIRQFEKWFAANKQLIASGINTFLDRLSDVLQVLWKDGLKVLEFLGPLVTYLGGAEGAVNKLITAFLVFKGIQIAGSFASAAGAIGGLVGMVWKTVAAMGGLAAAQTAVGAAGAAEGVGMAGAYSAASAGTAGAGAAAGGAGIVASTAAVGGAAVLGYAIGKYAINPLLDKIGNGEGLGGKIYDWTHPEPAGGPSGAQTQNNTFNSTTNLTLGHSAPLPALTDAVADAHAKSNDKTITKLKADSARNKQY